MKQLSCAAIVGLSIGTFFAGCWIAGDVGRRLNALEQQAKVQHATMVMCLDSINELANPGGSITEENTVPEVRK